MGSLGAEGQVDAGILRTAPSRSRSQKIIERPTRGRTYVRALACPKDRLRRDRANLVLVNIFGVIRFCNGAEKNTPLT